MKFSKLFTSIPSQQRIQKGFTPNQYSGYTKLFKQFPSLFNRLKYKIVYSVSSFFKTDEHQELLKKVNTRLLVWDQKLFNLNSGDSTAIDDMSADALASAAGELLKKDKKRYKLTRV